MEPVGKIHVLLVAEVRPFSCLKSQMKAAEYLYIAGLFRHRHKKKRHVLLVAFVRPFCNRNTSFWLPLLLKKHRQTGIFSAFAGPK